MEWGRRGLGLYGSVYGQVAVFCECGNEPSRLMKYGNYVV